MSINFFASYTMDKLRQSHFFVWLMTNECRLRQLSRRLREWRPAACVSVLQYSGQALSFPGLAGAKEPSVRSRDPARASIRIAQNSGGNHQDHVVTPVHFQLKLSTGHLGNSNYYFPSSLLCRASCIFILKRDIFCTMVELLQWFFRTLISPGVKKCRSCSNSC